MIKGTTLLAALVLISGPSPSTAGSFDIDLSFSGLSASQEVIFSQAEATWESIITGYQTDVGIPVVDISASGVSIDGPGGILGRAGPRSGAGSGGFLYTASGIMEFDTDDLGALESNGSLLDVILHEIAHVLGFGTLWDPLFYWGSSFAGFQDVYDNNGGFTGAAALAAYRAEFDAAAVFVPVELGGGDGTAGAHWNEHDGGGGLTGIVGPDGDFYQELMTGWLNAPTYISNTTKASFIDIGYTVNLGSSAAVPEPGTFVLLATGLVGLVGYTRRRS